jgi:lysyl endopeptidase
MPRLLFPVALMLASPALAAAAGGASCPARFVAAAATGSAFAPDAIRVPTRELGTRLPDAAMLAVERQRRFDALLDGRPVIADAEFVDLPLARAQRDALLNDVPRLGEPLRIGTSVSADLPVAFGAGTRAEGRGGERGRFGIATDGARVWEIGLRSRDAEGVRIRFDAVRLAAGATLSVYNEAGQAVGPYRDAAGTAGRIWSGSVFGDAVRVQLRAPDAVALAASRFTIAALLHVGPRDSALRELRSEYRFGPEPDDRDFCGTPVPDCTQDATCALAGEPALAAAAKAVAMYSFVHDDGGGAACTGTLLNDADATGTPWFLTANHCVATASEAATVEARFDRRTTACGSCQMLPAVTVEGATLLATGAGLELPDFSLLRLSHLPPGRTLLGWSATRPANGVRLYHLSHPLGSPLAYSYRTLHASDSSVLCGNALAPYPYLLSGGLPDWAGAVYPGSSGAAALVLDGGQTLVVGQLHGGCLYDPVNLHPCEPAQESTVDGSMAEQFRYLAPFLTGVLFADGFEG